MASTRWTKLKAVSQYLPEVNFITIHYGYFIFTSLATALIFWGSAKPFGSVSFSDSLFLCASAMTEAGLNTVNLSELTIFQQFILFFLIMIGSAIFVSIFVVHVRLRSFEKQFKHTIKARRELRDRSRAGRSRSKSLLRRPTGAPGKASLEAHDPEIGSSPTKEKADLPTPNTLLPSEGTHEKLSTAVDAETTPRLRLQIDGKGEQGPSRTIKFDTQAFPPNSREAGDGRAQSPSSLKPLEPSHSFSERNAGNFPERMKRPFLSFTGVGATASSSLRPRSASRATESRQSQAVSSALDGPVQPPSTPLGKPTDPFFASAAGFFARNSAVHNLSLHERQQLGGCEYSAILVLSIIVPLYFIAWQLLGALACGAWVSRNRPDAARQNGINPFWVGSFNAISAFNNSGMSLLDANMTAFQDSYFMLLSMGLFILAGNTAYPIFLRLIIWTIQKVLPDDEAWKYDKQTLDFLLNHPRRCYTNLFPSSHTWWLASGLIALNGIDWAMFEILNIGNTAITKPLSTRAEVLDGLFQALAVRSGGFYVVAISATRISLQVLYVVMMYISAYPVAITIRNSNVYEERSLGIYEEDLEATEDATYERNQTVPLDSTEKGFWGQLKGLAQTARRAPARQAGTHFVRQQLRAQLSHDAWWICLAIFLISIIEGGRFESDPVVFSCFNIIFEVVSAYACVGISVGVPWAAFSFCGAWHKLSKLILVAVMIRGRHRGLPVAIDHAVNLPGQQMWMAEEEDGEKKLKKSATMRDNHV